MKPISSKQQDFIAESIEAYKQKEALNRAKLRREHKATIAVVRRVCRFGRLHPI